MPKENWSITNQISPQNILNKHGVCTKLEVLAICSDGTGRSVRVANELNKENIKAASLEGGLRKVYEDPEVRAHMAYLAGLLNNDMANRYVATILTPEEILHYNQFLLLLKKYQYSRSEQAIQSLTKIIKG
jgi:hypothetical protein